MAIKIDRTTTCSVCSETNHYYGTTVNPNDVIKTPQGSIWYLRDNPKDPNTGYHPYLVIYDTHMDKIGKIATFSISSTPTIENMIPIIFNNSIGYINWHHPVNFKLSEFDEKGSIFLGTIVNKEPFKLAMMLYTSIYLNIGDFFDCSKSNIINRFLDYIDEFEIRAKNYEPYEHKVLPTTEYTKKLRLQITFTRDSDIITTKPDSINAGDDVVKIELPVNNNDVTVPEPIVDVIEDTVEDTLPPSVKIKVTKRGRRAQNKSSQKEVQKEKIIIDLKSQALLTAVSKMEEMDNMPLQRQIKNMSTDDIRLFMAYLKFNSQAKAAKLYGMTTSGINKKSIALRNKYDITYIV